MKKNICKNFPIYSKFHSNNPLSNQVAKDTDGEGNPTLQEPRPLCGYFLFVVTNAGAGVADGNCCQATLPVYLKPSFSVAGLWKVLSTPGSKVMLRDVLYRGNGGWTELINYSQNVSGRLCRGYYTKTLQQQ